MKRLIALLCMLFLCLTALPLWVSADMGPKPELSILVKNAPESTYYLDLLITEDVRGTYNNLYDNPYDEALLAGLHSWEDEGWYPAFAGGTKAPLFGDLIPNEKGVHRFTYFGLPQTFRIAFSSADGAQATAESFTRTAFYTNLVYDCETNSFTPKNPASWLAPVIQFLATFLPTLLAEGAILFLFRFKLKENLLALLVVNLVTQLGLHLVIGSGFITLASSFFIYLILMFPAEGIILILEMLAYSFLLKGDFPRSRRQMYALAANLASWCLTFFSLQPLVTLLRYF